MPGGPVYRIEKAMRDEIEKGIAANAKELAVHGKPQPTFFMMGGWEISRYDQNGRGQVKLVVEKAEDIGDEHNEHQSRRNGKQGEW